MSRIKTILVDDEVAALKGLEQKVKKLFPEIVIVNTFQKPEEAITAIENEPPDILFLDIEMPRMSGFELLSQLKQINFQVIFVTAYSEYALDALKNNAVDYVLKPVDNEDLKNAVQKALGIMEQKSQNEAQAKLVELLHDTLTSNDKLIVPTTKGLSFIPQGEVLHLEGYDGYTKIHLIDNTEIVSSYNLGRFEKSLSNIFFKCHKSHIINIKKVRSYENEGYVVLENEYRVPISKTNRKVFLNLFK